MEQAQQIQEQPSLIAYLTQLGVISAAVFVAMKGLAFAPQVERMDPAGRHRFKFWVTILAGMGMPMVATAGGWLLSPVGGWAAYLNALAFGALGTLGAMGGHALTKGKPAKKSGLPD